MHELFDRSEIVRVLQGFNPWWAQRSHSVPDFKRLAYNACWAYLNDKELRRAVLLSGPRRVGKTVLLQQIASGLLKEGADSKSILYLSLDHPLLKLLSLRDILAIYNESIYPERSPGWLLLDEIQYSKEWETEIKLLVDHQPHYRILATGSATVTQKTQLVESGVGRWITVPIPTLSFYEFIHIRGERVTDVPEQLRPNDLFSVNDTERLTIAELLRPLMPSFQRYLLVGGFPETAIRNDVSLSHRLLREDVVERVLKRDMTSLFGIRRVNELEKLFIYLCLHTGGILQHKTVATALETTHATVSNYLELLEQANLVYRLTPAEVSGKKILRARYKYYLVDAALRNAVLLRGEEVLDNPVEMGVIVETTILRHLYAYYYRDTPEIKYWRDTTTSKEVDIIVRSPSYHFPVEVKYRDSAKFKSNSGLAFYCRDQEIQQAYVITKTESDFAIVKLQDAPTQILKIPAHIFCYLIGQAEQRLWSGDSQP